MLWFPACCLCSNEMAKWQNQIRYFIIHCFDELYEILWKSYGTSNETIDLYYSTGGDSNTYKPGYCVYTDNWSLIAGNLDNSGSYNWDLSSSGLTDTDSLRIKIIASNGESCDINGHYIKIRSPARASGSRSRKLNVSWSNRWNNCSLYWWWSAWSCRPRLNGTQGLWPWPEPIQL